MLRRLRGRKPTAVLDLGCGTGQFLRRLAAAVPDAELHGLDLSPGMLAEASGRTLDTRGGLVLGDAHHLPFAPASFDAVTCSESFHWYHDQSAALRELATVVRPDGQLLIASVATTTDAGDRVMRRLSRAAGQPLRAIPPRRMAQLLEDAGFELVDQRRIPRLGAVPWPVLTDARRRG
jgi:ubiquinone/menaquinone biosynthesis C-methylase UbiE